jgi:hypothetical protein
MCHHSCTFFVVRVRGQSSFQSSFSIARPLKIGNQMLTRVSSSTRRIQMLVIAIATTLLLTLTLASSAAADPCVVNDPSGTVTLPPVGCEYLTGVQVHEIIDGLPLGTTIELAPIHKDFICNDRALGPNCDIPAIPGVSCEEPGGDLGGNADCFDSTLEFQITGTGTLAGFSRTISVGAPSVVDTGPRVPGQPVQSFDTEIVALQGQLFGDPDFCVLNIRAGSDLGLPSSAGHTTLTALGGNNWNVDSFFDVQYEIEFVGCPGSVLEGFGGISQGQVTMQAGDPILGAPGMTGSWLILFVSVLAGSAFYLMRRHQAA